MRPNDGLEAWLPFADRALVEEKKILEYLLNPDHPVGGSKAKFFVARGFTSAEWAEFRSSLISHAQTNAPTRRVRTEWGLRYTVECNCSTPDGRNPCIRTVWEIGADERPRLLTAIPLS